MRLNTPANALTETIILYTDGHTDAGFCPEIKSIGTNGPLSLKKVGHHKIWGPSELPIYDANGLSAFRQVEKTWELLNYS